MPLIPIVTNTSELRKKSQEVSKEDGERIGKLLVEQLKLRSKEAVGLAAPQLGIDARVFAMKDGEEYKFFINPVIITASGIISNTKEGCLSMPGRTVKTNRSDFIVWADSFGKGTLKEFPSIIFQHEYDHLNGILMTEREINLYKLCPCGSGKKYKFCHARR